jgi:hypothetical protein
MTGLAATAAEGYQCPECGAWATTPRIGDKCHIVVPHLLACRIGQRMAGLHAKWQYGEPPLEKE